MDGLSLMNDDCIKIHTSKFIIQNSISLTEILIFLSCFHYRCWDPSQKVSFSQALTVIVTHQHLLHVAIRLETGAMLAKTRFFVFHWIQVLDEWDRKDIIENQPRLNT